MNRLLNNHISVEGIDNALELAKTLIKNNYQVFIQLDDCNIYIVSYETNDASFGDCRFASISEEEEEYLDETRELAKDGEDYDDDEDYDDWLDDEDEEDEEDADGDEESDEHLKNFCPSDFWR